MNFGRNFDRLPFTPLWSPASVPQQHCLHTDITLVSDTPIPPDIIIMKLKPSAYIPKPPQTLEPEPARIAMIKLSQSKKTRVAKRKQNKKTSQTVALLRQTGLTACPDRSDRSGWDLKMPTGQTGQTGCSQTAREQNLQIANLEQTKSKFDETWRR